jgi:hypothetical protein
VTPQRLHAQMEAEATAHLRRVVDALPHDLSVTTLLRHGDRAARRRPRMDDDRAFAEPADDDVGPGVR